MPHSAWASLSVTCLFALVESVGLGACEPNAQFLEGGSARAGAVRTGTPEPSRGDFAESTESPQPSAPAADAASADLRAACGASDAALDRVAHRLIQGPPDARLDADALSYELRAAGSPYVWPHAWRFDGTERQLGEAKARMQHWLLGFADGGTRRCGIALRRDAKGRLHALAIAVDVLADLAPLPTRVRVGQWLSVNARLLTPADTAKVFVLGPRGAPYAVPSSFDHGELRARFNADVAGSWEIQVLATVAGGPRPLLEALVFAGTEPSSAFTLERAPGEDATPNADPRAALYAMINAARATVNAQSLVRVSTLEALAQHHADAMRRARKTAHDAGDGDLTQRMEDAGLALRAGENVAHAANASLAHRALWASPSHRENLLFPDYDSVGVGVARDPDGTLWVCEVFAVAK